jgi:hypothetical protein
LARQKDGGFANFTLSILAFVKPAEPLNVAPSKSARSLKVAPTKCQAPTGPF